MPRKKADPKPVILKKRKDDPGAVPAPPPLSAAWLNRRRSSASSRGPSLTVTFTGWDDEGAATGMADGKLVHAAGGAPGGAAIVRIEHESPHSGERWGSIAGWKSKPKGLVDPPCAVYGFCGGCALQHLDRETQISFKTAAVQQAFAGYESLAEVPVEVCRPSPRDYRYRNTARYVCTVDEQGNLYLGQYAKGTHDVVPTAECHIHPWILNEAARKFADWARAELENDPGFGVALRRIRHFVVRLGYQNELMVVVVSLPGEIRQLRFLYRHLSSIEGAVISGIVHNIQPDPSTDVIFGPDNHLLGGRDSLDVRMNGLTFHVSAMSFLQGNYMQAEWAYKEISDRAAVKPGTCWVDLYCGVGGISLSAARAGAVVQGYEVNPHAVRDAIASASLNRLLNARFETMDAAAAFEDIRAKRLKPRVVSVNPPRKGCGALVLDGIHQLAPEQVFYMSCNPESLARDLDLLVQLGYGVQWVQPFDMLPQTRHVEVIAHLRRKPS
ncbi:MAG: 23S rRNA (uracil-C(5))-methyltransferase RlmCD [Myxococcota bacterium]|nr:23S rRNA (uracil-C(5))-methyltransferase RlmCD [Myxococcota bacterium]